MFITINGTSGEGKTRMAFWLSQKLKELGCINVEIFDTDKSNAYDLSLPDAIHPVIKKLNASSLPIRIITKQENKKLLDFCHSDICITPLHSKRFSIDTVAMD